MCLNTAGGNTGKSLQPLEDGVFLMEVYSRRLDIKAPSPSSVCSLLPEYRCNVISQPPVPLTNIYLPPAMTTLQEYMTAWITIQNKPHLNEIASCWAFGHRFSPIILCRPRSSCNFISHFVCLSGRRRHPNPTASVPPIWVEMPVHTDHPFFILEGPQAQTTELVLIMIRLLLVWKKVGRESGSQTHVVVYTMWSQYASYENNLIFAFLLRIQLEANGHLNAVSKKVFVLLY